MIFNSRAGQFLLNLVLVLGNFHFDHPSILTILRLVYLVYWTYAFHDLQAAAAGAGLVSTAQNIANNRLEP